jgi:rare lipoprotein A
LLSILNRIFIVVLIFFIFTACSKRKYYSSNTYKNSNSYKKLKTQKIKNSKAMHRATMRSYIVHGKRYTPTKTHVGEIFEGIASWYGPNFHSKLTSNGEMYDMYASTAASKTLPMNTIVKVYNKDNGKTTIVRINDRGPFVIGRIIDLSNKAAHDVDMVKKGTANVKIQVLGFDAEIAKTNAQRNIAKYSEKYYLQVGVFSNIKGAKTVKRKFNTILDFPHKTIIKQDFLNGNKINRVWIDGFRSYEEAKDFKSEEGLNNAIILAH